MKKEANIMFTSNGEGYKTAKLSIPTKWIAKMGITPEKKLIEMDFDGETITIKKAKEKLMINFESCYFVAEHTNGVLEDVIKFYDDTKLNEPINFDYKGYKVSIEKGERFTPADYVKPSEFMGTLSEKAQVFYENANVSIYANLIDGNVHYLLTSDTSEFKQIEFETVEELNEYLEKLAEC